MRTAGRECGIWMKNGGDMTADGRGKGVEERGNKTRWEKKGTERVRVRVGLWMSRERRKRIDRCKEK